MSAAFTLRRLHDDGLSTIGQLFAPDGRPMNFRLEPGPRTPVHPRIPAGRYRMELRAAGDKWKKFSAVPELRELIKPGLVHIIVPGREWILDHPGNSIADTEGCSLPGMKTVSPRFAHSGHWEVSTSRIAFEQDYEILRDAIFAGDAFWNVLSEGGV